MLSGLKKECCSKSFLLDVDLATDLDLAVAFGLDLSCAQTFLFVKDLSPKDVFGLSSGCMYRKNNVGYI